NFTLTSDDINTPGGTVVATGAINATGQDVVISDTEDQFVFPDGTLTIIHAPVRTHDHFNEKKCSGTYRVVGTVEGGCNGPDTGTLTITARGSINLPDA